MRMKMGRHGRPRITKAYKARKRNIRVANNHEPSVSKTTFLKALTGTFGVQVRIAENLGVRRNCIRMLLARPDWDDMRQAVTDEQERMADDAENALAYCIRQNLDVGTKARTAQWLLSRPRHSDRRLGDESKMVLEGGDKPVSILSGTAVDVTTLDLPAKVQMAILEALEEKERQLQERKESEDGEDKE